MLIATLSVATDLALGVPLEHRLRSTLAAMRLCDTSGVDQETASQTYFLCLLFYVGCTASVDLDPDTFGDDDGLTAYALPSRFGTRPEILGGYLRALASPDASAIFRARQLLGAPRLVRAFPSIVAAVCEVGRMLTDPAAKGWSGAGRRGRQLWRRDRNRSRSSTPNLALGGRMARREGELLGWNHGPVDRSGRSRPPEPVVS